LFFGTPMLLVGIGLAGSGDPEAIEAASVVLLVGGGITLVGLGIPIGSALYLLLRRRTTRAERWQERAERAARRSYSARYVDPTDPLVGAEFVEDEDGEELIVPRAQQRRRSTGSKYKTGRRYARIRRTDR
jgi:hypothetical protein